MIEPIKWLRGVVSSITDYQKRKPVGTCIANVPIDIVHRSRLRGGIKMQMKEVVQLLQAAIEASVYAAPREPGLTSPELYEVGRRAGLKEGEIGDAMRQVSTQYVGGGSNRLLFDGAFGIWPDI